MKTHLALMSFASTIVVSVSAHAGPLDTLRVGEWLEVPSSHLRSVDPCPAHTCSYSAVEGVASVIDDWSGGAFDTSRDRLLVWGGGHGGYAGNEIYAFSLSTLTWSRLTSPSDPPGVDVPYAPDGRPTSRHTYNYVQYLPAIDAFCSFGGAGFYVTGQTGTAHTDCYNFGTGAWQALGDAVTLGSFIGGFSAVDPTTGHAWEHGCGGYSTLAELDAGTNTWTSHGGMWTESVVIPTYYLTAAVSPTQHLFVAVGDGVAYSWDLSPSGDIAGQNLTTTGDMTVRDAASPGFDYDSTSGLLVGWAGGTDIFTLDPATWAWTRVPAAATNTVTPTTKNMNGTFGRFRYSPTSNVFVVVNRVDDDVFIYRLTDGSGTAPPSVVLTAAPLTVGAGGTSTLSWSSTSASTCTASGGWSGSRSTTGSETVGPLSQTTTFVLTCSGAGGLGGSTVTVTVPGADGGPGADGATAADGAGGDPGSGGDPNAGGESVDFLTDGYVRPPADTGVGPGASSAVSGSCSCGPGRADVSWLALALFALARRRAGGRRVARSTICRSGRPDIASGERFRVWSL